MTNESDTVSKTSPEYGDIVEIFYQLLALGLREAAYNLSIMLNKPIDIREPLIRSIPYRKALQELQEERSVFRAGFVHYAGQLERNNENIDTSGLMLFIISQDENKRISERYSSIADTIRAFKPDVADSVVMEMTNILGSSILKKLSDKTSVRFNISTPVLHTKAPDELAGEIEQALKQHNYKEDQDTIIVKTAFVDKDKEVQLLLMIYAGNSFDLLTEKIADARRGW